MPDLKLWGERELLKLRNDMDRLFDSLCSDLGLPCLESSDRELSLQEDVEFIVLRASLPGFSPENVQVTVNERSISIEARASRKLDGALQTQNIRRKLDLPCIVRPEQSSATFSEGILEVRMPKDRACKPSRLRISGR